MGMQVCNGASLKCSFGVAPSMLTVIPLNRTLSGYQPAATIMDHKPTVNILPFGMCSSPTNPSVASATAAAMGVLTPMPCIPVTPAPWVVGSPTVLINNQPSLNNSAKLMCAWAGVINIVSPGQTTNLIP